MDNQGFLPEHAIPLDVDGELLGGAHRTACAIALGVPAHIVFKSQKAWAPAWGLDWFTERNAPQLDRIMQDWEYLNGQADTASTGNPVLAHHIGELQANG